jgi:SAM-dependent methyltransferase
MDLIADDTGAVPAAPVVWHELECGRYSADMELWRELAAVARERDPAAKILDVGAGSGRVTLALAREGHSVTALDLDRLLLDALERRAAAEHLQVTAVCADARDFTLDSADFALCVIPMQTIQLLGGSDGRLAFLRRAHAHLRASATLACAIVTELEPFDIRPGQPAPTPEVVGVGTARYSSQATAVRVNRRHIRIERLRTIATPGARTSSEHNAIELDRVSAVQLAAEGHRAGFAFEGVREIPATDEHVGSEVVMLSA